MYQVLYRKYRPQTFEDVCGQNVVVQILKNSIINKKISHAYLFAGPRGTGKTSMAKIFARIINCENADNLRPCDVCVNCTQTTNDVIEIDAASNNGVDEIRELRNNVGLVPTTGKYKVYIIDEVHMLTTGAFNALLKTLEEPPAHVIFILATTDPHKIPETILSRCQRLEFKKISVDDIVTKLSEIAKKEGIKADVDSLKEIAILSDGGLRDSISLLDEASIFSNNEITKDSIHTINGTLTHEELSSFIKYMVKGDYVKIFECIDKYNSCGKNFVKLTEEIIAFLKDILMYIVAPDYFREIKYNVENIENISQEIPENKIITYIHEFNDCFNEMANTNNHKLLFELSIIKLMNTSKNVEKNENVKIISEEKNKNIEKKETIKEENIIPQKSFPQHEVQVNTIENEKNVENFYEEDVCQKVDEELLSHLREIRINNTLAKFNKKLSTEIKKQLENITGFLLEPAYSQYVSIIMDGVLKATSEDNLIFVFNKKVISDDFNMNLLIVEELLEQVLGKHFDVISTWDDEWEIIKNEFNGKKKEYIYKKEEFDLKEILSQETKDELTSLFGDIIEYS